MPYKNIEAKRANARKWNWKLRGTSDSGRRKGNRVKSDDPNHKYLRDKDGKRDSYLQTRYGISLEDYNRMFMEQNGCCAICGEHASENWHGLHVDHDHKTGKVRNLLCHQCNAALGNFRDDVDLLNKAIKYLGG